MYVIGIAAALLVAIAGAYLATLPQLHWQIGGWLFVAVATLGVTLNAPAILNPAKFAFLRLGEQSLECRLGYQKWTVGYLTVGRFHIAKFLGGDYLSWRSREYEERMDPAAIATAPDPFDNLGEGVKLPRYALPTGESLERICADLNRLRANAMIKAGLAEVAVGSKRNLVQPRPFLAPPAIGRVAFTVLFFGHLFVYLVAAFFAYPSLRRVFEHHLLAAQLIETGTLIPSLSAALTLGLVYFLVASWIVFARLRDIDRNTRWGMALSQTYDLIIFTLFSYRAWSRLVGRRGMR
jgi:hypothetical protein